MLFILGGFTAVTYLLVGIVAGVSPMMWEESSATDQVLWIVILVGGGLLLVAELWLVKRSPWVGAALISLGGVVGRSDLVEWHRNFPCHRPRCPERHQRTANHSGDLMGLRNRSR